MGSPRPSFGRAENYGPEGRYEYGGLGGPRSGLNNLNSYIISIYVLFALCYISPKKWCYCYLIV